MLRENYPQQLGTANCEAMFDYCFNPRQNTLTNMPQHSIVPSYIIVNKCSDGKLYEAIKRNIVSDKWERPVVKQCFTIFLSAV